MKNRRSATERQPTRTPIFSFVAVLTAALIFTGNAFGQRDNPSIAQDTQPKNPPSAWHAIGDIIKQRRSQNQPLVQPATFPDMQIEKACSAAQQEMQRRGLVAGHARTARVTKAGHSNLNAQNRAAQKTSPVAQASHTYSHNVAVESSRGADSIDQATQYAIDNIHANCFCDTEYPSATQCRSCHPGHYQEWAVSPHAYAQLSPVFNAMSNKLIQMNNGTLGDFCIRCHTPVGMALKQPIAISNLDRTAAEREGVTCIVCHRVNQNWGKVSGRQALVGGGLDQPIYGPLGNDILQQVLATPEKFGVLTTGPKDARTKSREIHGKSIPFFALTTSATCASCHDVFAPNGFRLEDAFSEFKTSPAAKLKQQNCQDCHMGVSPGIAAGYDCAPAAIVGNAHTPARKRTNHMMVGPDYSIVHPGIFPHNPEAVKEEYSSSGTLDLGLATMREWLLFDYKAGWGTQHFEQSAGKTHAFPEPWKSASKRIRARDILNDQFEMLDEATIARHQLLRTGYHLGEIVPQGTDRRGLRFKIKVSNGTDGHGVPTGFDAERLVFLRVTVYDRNGKLVFVSGDLDPNGDVRDSHSAYVHNGKLPIDRQLFSLQTRFLTRNIRGGEREQVLAVPFSLDPLPYTRPATRPFTVLGRPIGARKHKQNLEVGGHRWAEYCVPCSQLTGDGPYHAEIQLVAGMVPVNLVHAISSAGFDYGMTAKEIAEAVVAGHVIVHSRKARLNVNQ